jgi:hypothetical protein
MEIKMIEFDDTYTGPRWTYGLQFRPIASSHIPDGWIIGSDRPNPEYNHGTVQYPRQLSDDEVQSFQLSEID